MGINLQKTKKLIVSIHDVCPFYFEEIKQIISILENIGIKKLCLKVIPNYSGKWNILNNKNFLSWILEKGKKSEIIQHGYTHINFKKSNESEFSSSSYEQALESIEKGKEIMKKASIDCKGFTSPTWKQSKETAKAIFDSGFEYFTTLSGVKVKAGEKFFLPAFGFHGVSKLLENCAMIGNIISDKIILPFKNINRIVLHPQKNILKNRAFLFLIEVLRKLIERSELITYYEFIQIKRK